MTTTQNILPKYKISLHPIEKIKSIIKYYTGVSIYPSTTKYFYIYSHTEGKVYTAKLKELEGDYGRLYFKLGKYYCPKFKQ